MEPLNDLESSVLEMLLDGDRPVLAALREQARCCSVEKREFSGVGFFADLHVPRDVPSAAVPTDGPRITLGDVYAEAESLEHGAGFVLFVEDGRLDMLEGFTYDEPWPEDLGRVSLAYVEPNRDIWAKLK